MKTINIEEAILLLVEAGFEVVNKRGGYIGKNEKVFHQSADRSTYVPDDEKVALDSFLRESEN